MKNYTKLVVFISGGGSNFISIHQSIIRKEILGSIELVVSNKAECRGIMYAKEHNLPTKIINETMYDKYEKYELDLLKILNNTQVDLILLAGYLKKVPKLIIKQYEKKILNIHPSLLPKFGGKGYFGMNVHKEVIKSKEEFSGASIHFVSDKYDEGPIVFQKKIKIQPNQTPEDLAKKILAIEHEIYPFVVKSFCANKIKWIDNKPIII